MDKWYMDAYGDFLAPVRNSEGSHPLGDRREAAAMLIGDEGAVSHMDIEHRVLCRILCPNERGPIPMLPGTPDSRNKIRSTLHRILEYELEPEVLAAACDLLSEFGNSDSANPLLEVIRKRGADTQDMASGYAIDSLAVIVLNAGSDSLNVLERRFQGALNKGKKGEARFPPACRKPMEDISALMKQKTAKMDRNALMSWAYSKKPGLLKRIRASEQRMRSRMLVRSS